MTTIDLAPQMEMVTTRPVAAVAVPFVVATSDGIAATMNEGFTELYMTVEHLELAVVGAPRAYYQSMGADGISGYLALPVDAGDIEGTVMLPGGRWMRFVHRGPYKDLARTYGAIGAALTAKGRMKNASDWEALMPMWEEYPDDPQTTSVDHLTTYIYLPA